MAGLAHPSGLVRRHERRGDFGHGSEMANECMMALLTVLTGMLDLIKQGFSCTGRWKALQEGRRMANGISVLRVHADRGIAGQAKDI